MNGAVKKFAVTKPNNSILKLSGLIPVIGLFVGFSANAQSSYQYENFISYLQYDNNSVIYTDHDEWTVSLGGVSYFKQVDTTRGPLAEAAFLNRASGARLIYSRTETEVSMKAWGDYEASGETRTDYAIGQIEYFIPDSIFYLSLGVAAAQARYSSSMTEDYVTETTSEKSDWDYKGVASLGITPLDGLMFWSDFYEGQELGDQWILNGKYVLLLSGERALNFQAGYAVQKDEDYGDITSPSISSDYYFNKTFSVGLAYYLTDYEDADDDKTYELRARKFFGENVSVQASVAELDEDRTALIGAGYRF